MRDLHPTCPWCLTSCMTESWCRNCTDLPEIQFAEYLWMVDAWHQQWPLLLTSLGLVLASAATISTATVDTVIDSLAPASMATRTSTVPRIPTATTAVLMAAVTSTAPVDLVASMAPADPDTAIDDPALASMAARAFIAPETRIATRAPVVRNQVAPAPSTIPVAFTVPVVLVVSTAPAASDLVLSALGPSPAVTGTRFCTATHKSYGYPRPYFIQIPN